MAKGKFSIIEIMNSQSLAEKKPQGGEGFKVEDIPIEKIKPSAANIYGIRDVEELAASIEAMGLMHNLLVRPADENGYHELVSGERRYQACKLIHEADESRFATVPCKVEAAEGDALAELKATARELTDYEKTTQARRIKELLLQLKKDGHEFKGRMRDIVAEMLDVSPAQMGRMDSINDHLAEGFREEFKAGNIGITTAYDASTLTEEEQAAALEGYKEKGAEAVKEAKTRQKREAQTKTAEEPTTEAEEPTQKPGVCQEPTPAGKTSRAMVSGVVKQSARGSLVEEATEAARNLRAVADIIPYDATCEVNGDELNMKAVCIAAAKHMTWLIEYLKLGE